VEDYDKAEEWLRIVETCEGKMNGGCLLRHIANQAEIAVVRGNAEAATQLLSRPDLARLGDSVRGRIYFASLEMRNRQIDLTYQADDDALGRLAEMYERIKRLCCADSLVLAYGEALLRRGKHERLRTLMQDYRTARRELSPLPPSLRRIADAVVPASRAVFTRQRSARSWA
jgi:hypothetical protein